MGRFNTISDIMNCLYTHTKMTVGSRKVRRVLNIVLLLIIALSSIGSTFLVLLTINLLSTTCGLSPGDCAISNIVISVGTAFGIGINFYGWHVYYKRNKHTFSQMRKHWRDILIVANFVMNILRWLLPLFASSVGDSIFSKKDIIISHKYCHATRS